MCSRLFSEATAVGPDTIAYGEREQVAPPTLGPTLTLRGRVSVVSAGGWRKFFRSGVGPSFSAFL